MDALNGIKRAAFLLFLLLLCAALPGGAQNAKRTRLGLLLNRGEGKVGEVTVKSGKPGDAETFQWVDLQRGDTLLLSQAKHRYIIAPKDSGAVGADHPGAAPDRKDGSAFAWKLQR